MTAALSVLLPGFTGTTAPEWLLDRLERGLAGVCLFGENVADPNQLAALTAQVSRHRPAAVIAIDEEGGDVTRLYAATGSPDPGNGWLGRRDDVALTAAVAADLAGRLRAVGVTLNLAPCADVNSNPRNPVIGVRSFGADPALVARHTAAWVSAHESGGVATCLKHFPGHGDTDQDSHVSLPEITASKQEWAERDLPPFVAGIAAGAATVMLSHLRVPGLDAERVATFSPTVVEGVLRRELGFAGVIVTDALDMAGAALPGGMPAAAVAALAAGCDLLCLGSATDEATLDAVAAEIDAAVGDGRLPMERLTEAADRVAALGSRPTGPQGSPQDTPPAVDPVELTDEEIAAAFALSPRARTLLPAHRGRWRIVLVETAPTIAAGWVPWGPGAAGGARLPIIRITEEAAAGDLPGKGEHLVVCGRGLDQHAWTRAAVAALRAIAAECLLVEMGAPPGPDDTLDPDVLTYGASAAIGRALVGLIETGRANRGAR